MTAAPGGGMFIRIGTLAGDRVHAVYSHSRFPSLTDTTCNLIGTALGAFVAVGGYARATSVPVEGGVS